MGWLDDLRTRAEQSLENIGTDIQTYVKTRVTDAVVKVGEPQKGNQTAAQIANGQSGAPVANAPPASQAGSQLMKYLPFLAVGGLVVLFFSRKGK